MEAIPGYHGLTYGSLSLIVSIFPCRLHCSLELLECCSSTPALSISLKAQLVIWEGAVTVQLIGFPQHQFCSDFTFWQVLSQQMCHIHLEMDDS